MIVCSCNVISDHDVRACVVGAANCPRTAAEVHACLGCSAQCGGCARTIRKLLRDAVGAAECAVETCGGCPAHAGR